MTNNSERGGYRLTRTGRCLLGLWTLALLAGFAAAASVPPDPRGYGTHEAFGMPACSFRQTLNIPCPSCGMTTSFSHFVRGQFVQSARANRAGLFLATACLLQIPWCWLSIYQGRLWNIDRPDVALLYGFVAMSVVVLCHWSLLIFFG